MNLLLTSLAAALLTSGAALAAPDGGASAAAPSAASGQSSAAPSPSDRPSEERMALARRLIALTTPEDGGIQQMRDLSLQLASIGPGETESDSDRAYAEKFTDRVLVKAAPIIRDHMLSIREMSAYVYAREFSVSELQQLVAFAETPGGKHYFAREHFLDLDPAIVQQEMMMQDALRPVLFEVRKELCQEATAKRIAAGDKKAKCPLSQAKESQQG